MWDDRCKRNTNRRKTILFPRIFPERALAWPRCVGGATAQMNSILILHASLVEKVVSRISRMKYSGFLPARHFVEQ